MIAADIATFLSDSPAISNLIEDRIYAEVAPQGAAFPRIVLMEDEDAAEYALSGEAGVSFAEIEVHCWAIDTNGRNGAWQSKRLRDAVRNRLSGYRGTAGDSTIRGCTITSNFGADEGPKNGSDITKYRRILRFSITHTSPIPTHT